MKIHLLCALGWECSQPVRAFETADGAEAFRKVCEEYSQAAPQPRTFFSDAQRDEHLAALKSWRANHPGGERGADVRRFGVEVLEVSP